MNHTAVVTDLDRRLMARGDTDKKLWWERYLKHVIEFYGVGIPEIRTIVAEWHHHHDLGRLDADALLTLASHSVALPMAENKLAAILLLQEHGLDRLIPDRHFNEIAGWFDRGHIADWNTCDWLCVRVLGPLIALHGKPAAQQLAHWSRAPVLWRRRAGAVAFVNLAPSADANFAGFTELVLEVTADLVKDPQRFSQTAVGWVLRELSKAEPATVASFATDHVGQLSREAIRMATAKLPDTDRRELLAIHNGNPDVISGHAGR